MKHRRHGFTLIELSIVLVIIGLIVGGIVAGKDLVEMARTRKAMGELEAYTTATNAFKLKYNCLPGDCATATSFGFDSNGNGDGQVYEFTQYWRQLGQAGFISKVYSGTATPGSYNYGGGAATYMIGTDIPRSAIKDFIGVFVRYARNEPGDYQQWSMKANIYALSQGNMYENEGGIRSRTDIYPIDVKYDDGMGGTGRIQGMSNWLGNNGICTITTSPETATWASDWPWSTHTFLCSMYVEAGF